MTGERDPKELRRRAAELRHAAGHAERRRDAKGELEAAALLEAEADLLEGKSRPAPEPITPRTIEERDRARRARVDAVIDQLGERFRRQPP